ncbi:cytokine receptor-like factor 3 [Mizuhopecten yessoensis]|uniref:Cytokine receptor-like factor 3 n=1 Tax=Mizuhopecten yessoensis TaxID=6573 RepID=A0A210QY18_MIZYE|nr:cytokine receptor-like factor 3 [Mizuhopecten yessoensis]OWF53626.1 Cytokine receptor-like factor 3 [Mizuhopecten yessoensis]
MAEELIRNVVDIMEGAHTQKVQLSELLHSLDEAHDQVHQSADKSKSDLEAHFKTLKKAIDQALDERLTTLKKEVDKIEKSASVPLSQCKDMINQGMDAASRVMDEGGSILSGDPTQKIERMVQLKDNPDTRALNSVPAVPHLSDVPCISVELDKCLGDRLSELIAQEGRVLERSPIQITDTIERPGGILVKWIEVDDELEVSEFCLQYCLGNAKTSSSPTFHTAYTGPNTCYTVKNLNTNTPYSFRVSCRSSNNNSSWPWSVSSVPCMAQTTIPHYEWSTGCPSYAVCYDNKIATRNGTGDTMVLYSSTSSCVPGHPITFKVISMGETSPFDSVGLSLDNSNTDTLQQDDAILVTKSGFVFVDGQEMKIKLPEMKKGSLLTFDLEDLSNGKVRVNVELEEKVVTFDWKVPQPPGTTGQFGGFGLGGMLTGSVHKFYFGLKFSHEDWKVLVE